MRTISIHEATEVDASQIADVVESGIATLREVYRPTVRSTASLPPRARLVATLDDHVVGTLEHVTDGMRVHVMGLFVHAANRRQGVARALLADLADRALASGAVRLSLNTIRETGNVRVFKRLGFRAIDERVATFAESDRHPVLREVYMERELR